MENRIQTISELKFISLLKYTNNKCYIYKKIYEPTFNYGVYEKSFKTTSDEYVEYSNKNDIDIDTSFPIKDYSLVCSTNEEILDSDNNLGVIFLVFPYKDALFTIKSKNEYYKGFWSDKIVWLERFTKNELWTEDKCILIEKSIWLEYLKK